MKCHGAEKPKGNVRLDNLTDNLVKDGDRWLAVRDQIRDGLMPPSKKPRPEAAKVQATVLAITKTAGTRPSKLPNKGNLIPHELLFGKPAPAATPPPGRIWRLSADAYLAWVQSAFRGRRDGIVQPFTMIPDKGIKDFAGLYTIDEPTTEILLRNSSIIVEGQTAHDIKDGKVVSRGETVREYIALMDPAVKHTPEQIKAIIQQQHQMAIGRKASPEDVERFLKLYDKCAKAGDGPGAVKAVLQAVLLRSDALFRSELGGTPDNNGRRMLAPDELALALSLALGNSRQQNLTVAAAKGELATKEQIEAQLRGMLSKESKADRSRIMNFFRQYFEYGYAVDVFKEGRVPIRTHHPGWTDPSGSKLLGFQHRPGQLVADTEYLVKRIVDADQDVLRKLLTTDVSFVNFRLAEDKKTRMHTVQTQGSIFAVNNDRGWTTPDYVYGFEKWPSDQPVKLPEGKPRLGILMQPSWLVAFSTNFETDPVRRGRWIRERLLGQTVPDIPIGVVAQVPDEPHRTFRDRLTVTRQGRCWTCHQKMDDLGLPFEQFDPYAVFRIEEEVEDKEATEKNVDKMGKSLGKKYTTAKVDATGRIEGTGDPQLDGDVKDPYELVRRLAASDRVRQVFVRHAFRYFMGRNETLSDAKTLQGADAAYVKSGGSFNALVISLLTSDSFLYRSDLKTANAARSGSGDSR